MPAIDDLTLPLSEPSTLPHEPLPLVLRAAWGARWARPFTYVAFVAWSAFIAYACVVILSPIPRWWAAEPGWLDVVVGVALQPLICLRIFLWLDDRTPLAVRLTAAGIEWRDKRGRWSTLPWADPKFSLVIHVRGITKDAPLATLVWGGRLIPGTPVTVSSAEALLRVARERELDVDDSTLGLGRWRAKFYRIHPFRPGNFALR